MSELSQFFGARHAYEVSRSDDVSRADTLRQNSTRPASAEITYISNGVGQQRVHTPIIFPVIFRTEPHFTFGSAVIHNPNPKIWHDPIGQSGVYAWVRDSRGFFTGATIWVRVEVHPIVAGTALMVPPVTCQHYLTFTGLAFKDIPSNSLLPDLQPRTVGL